MCSRPGSAAACSACSNGKRDGEVVIAIPTLHKSPDHKQGFICRALYIEQKTISAPKKILAEGRDSTRKLSPREVMILAKEEH